MSTKDKLEKEGWRAASITGGQHLSRTLEMYQELRFEIYLEEIDTKECGACAVCYTAGDETIYRVYTRMKES
ncbi:hypothetical protein ACFLVX_04740 [Chloroflexota bacterium]